MKYIISETQYRRLNEQFVPADENNIIGDPSPNTLMFADFLLNQNLVEIGRMLISDDEIEIFGFEDQPFEYFNDNSLSFDVHTINNDLHVNAQGNDNDDEDDAPMRNEVYRYIANIAENFPFVTWYIEGTQL